MTDLLLRHAKALLIAAVALALSASLAFGAEPPGAKGLANAASHAGKTVPTVGDEETSGDEDTEEPEATEAPEAPEGDGGDNCATDATGLSEEDLAALTHGSIVCWAAHQAEWPEWFTNHGAFVKCWAHHGKADAPSCTEAPAAPDAAAGGLGNGHGKGQGKGKNKPD